MKKNPVYFFILIFLFTVQIRAQIVANHTIVDRFDDIPLQYIDSVKTMLLIVPGESHSAAYRDGLSQLEIVNGIYAADVVDGQPPQAYTNANLRVNRATWGDVAHTTGWQYSYGEEDWFTSETAITNTKAGISYCNAINRTIGAMGFGWCWDPAITDFSAYINATRSYNEYCADSINTKVFFTTGTVDSYTGETGYLKHVGYETMRDSVNNHANWALFDYADILCYDDDGEDSIVTWNGHLYPVIATKNLQGSGTGHIGMNGALRLAKAMWWMLARIKGWDGISTDVPADNADGILPAEFALNQNYPNPFNPTTTISFNVGTYGYTSIKIFNIMGKEVATLASENIKPGKYSKQWNASDFGSGVYFCRMQSGTFVSTRKLILIK